jgi:adenylate cyclase
VIVKIDEKTLNSLQSRSDQKMLTIPKSMYTILVEKLESAWVKGIAFDIIFQNTDKDEVLFADTMAKYPNIVISMMRYTGGECIRDNTGSVETCPGVPRSVYNSTRWWLIDMDDAYARPRSGNTIYQSSAVGITQRTSRDIDTLPLALLRTQAGHHLPKLIHDQVILNPYFGVPNSYPAFSLTDVLSMSKLDILQNFGNKYVLIGESGTAIHDSIISPVTGTPMDGVETHAHFLDGLLQNKMLSWLDEKWMMMSVGILTFLAVLLYFILPKYLSPLFAITILAMVLYAARYTYDIHRVLVDISLLFLAWWVITYPVTYIYRFFVVEREKRELQTNFGHYIDPHVVEEIASRGEDIQLGGERRVLSVLFSDIAGFTSISEKMAPQDLFYLMTSYLSNMTDILIWQGGTLDKYIGDAVMGFFGAPLSYTDHAVRAADTALMMRARLPTFNADLVAHGMEAIDFRVGISSGEVMVGNIGSHDRFNYTVLGDTVNVASRLEGMGKEYDVHVIIPESTEVLLTPHFLTRELDTIAVKGKTTGIRIYELVGYSEEVTDRTMYFTYAQALALYRAGDYRAAGKLWQTLAPIDPPSRIMMYRCLEIIKGNITVENGVYHMTHK